MTRRALLIGIDAYPHVRPLDGCVNDVHLMRSVLADTFAFPAEQVTTITNGQATRDGILAAFDALVAATGHDDIVVIHYAGHGSQMTDREGDEVSGFDSTIMPFDTARAPGENRDITDDEIHLKIDALAEKTAFTTLIFDACHSGTITRDVFGAKARSVEPDLRTVSDLPPSPIPAGRSRGSRTVGPSGWMPLADRYVLIAGCRDEERSYEYRPPEAGGAVAHGALSYFLCQQLRQVQPRTSYRDVFERVAALVNAENAIQHPQMEGRADRAVLGVEDLTPVRFVRITARDGESVAVGAGAAHGLTAGSTYQVFPPAAKDLIGGSPLGSIEILAVHALSADARVTEEVSQGAIEPGARAFESTHAFGWLTLAVECIAAPDFDKPRRGLLEFIGRSPLVRLADGEVPALRIYLLAARAEVTSSTPVPQAGTFDTPRWAVVDATGNLMSPLKPIGDEATVVDNLGTIARYRQALSIENPDPGSILRGRVTLELLRRGRDGTWAVTEPDAGGQVVFDEGELIGFRIASTHDASVYVSLLDFGLTRAVTPIFPPGGAQEQLAPGRTFDLGTDGRVTFPLRWPAGFPFVDSPDHLREADAVETVKLFVTEQPADFFVLRQPGVRSATATPSRLRALLQGAFHGAATRDIGMVTIGEEDWTTASRTFVLRRRSSVALPPTGAPVSLGSATVVAPGLTGMAHVSLGKRQREVAGRMVTQALHRALDASGVETRQTIEIADARDVGPSSRSVGDQPALELRLPDPGPGYGQMVLMSDELGVVSWCFAPPPAVDPGSRSADPATRVRTYAVPRGVPPTVDGPVGSRGLVGLLGTKFIKELVFPLIHPVLGDVGATFVNRLERERWPYRVRTFTPDDYARDEASLIDSGGWTRLGTGRALLMMHGTFSRTHLAFAQLPTDAVEALHRLYGERVFAFDHFTLSHDPQENIRWLVSQIPDTADLTLDIVAHSRGGLVSRLLSERQGELSLGARRIRIGKVVFVGAPCAGTALADPEHVGTALDVFTNLVNLLPDSGVIDVMTMVVEVAKQVAIGVLSGLDGLQSMRPNGDFAKWLNTGDRAGDTQYFAVASNVTPADPGLRHFALSHGLNRLLNGPNDFVVPTDGVFAANGSGFFPITDRLLLEGAHAAAHTKYFEDPRVRRRILEWLSA